MVTAIASGAATIDKIAEETDISARHVGYTLRAAQTLGLLDAAREPTPLGHALLETEQESDEERDVFQRSIETSPIVSAIAPRLLSPKPPTKKALGARIERLSGLSKATAEHRASDLLAWREQLLNEPEAPPAAAPDDKDDKGEPEEPASAQ